MARRGVTPLRRWAERNIIVGDGPRAGKPWRSGNAAWAEVLDAIGDPKVRQVTLRGSVQAGKTATLIASALGFFAAGHRVLILEPDNDLRRALSARIRAWARLCLDESVSGPWMRERPPHERGKRRRRLSERSERGCEGRDPDADGRRGVRRRAASVQARHPRRASGSGRCLRRDGEAHHRVECRHRGRVQDDERVDEVGRAVVARRLSCLRCEDDGTMGERALQESPPARLCLPVLRVRGLLLLFQARGAGRGVQGDARGGPSPAPWDSTSMPSPRRSKACRPSCACGNGPTCTASRPARTPRFERSRWAGWRCLTSQPRTMACRPS